MKYDVRVDSKVVLRFDESSRSVHYRAVLVVRRSFQ